MRHPIIDLIKQLPRHEHMYVLGGTVRDMILGQTPFDVDMGVLQNPEQAAVLIARHTGGRLVKLGRPGKDLVRIVIDRMNIDITALKGATIEEDLALRDFTANAMAWDLSTDKIIDRHGGREDISSKTIRMVSKGAFRDDPLRLLRAFRLAAVLNFDIEPITEQAVCDEAALIKRSAKERIREELLRMFEAPDAHTSLRKMAETDLLFGIIPEMTSLKGCRQNEYHQHDVLDHTLSVFYHLEKLLKDLAANFSDLTDTLRADLGSKEAALLKFACLLHDIGKPAAKKERNGGRVHFFRHEQLGADMSESICERLRFSVKETGFVSCIVRNHLRPFFLFQAFQKDELTQRAKTRFFMKCGLMTPPILLHAVADQMGKTEKTADAFLAFAVDLLRIYYSEFLPERSATPIITGRDLIDEFGMIPSPQFGEILSAIEELRLSKTIVDKLEALKYVKTHLISKNTR